MTLTDQQGQIPGVQGNFPTGDVSLSPCPLLKMQNTACHLSQGRDPIWIQLVFCGVNSPLKDQRGGSWWYVMGT